jgi:hypothetical protein
MESMSVPDAAEGAMIDLKQWARNAGHYGGFKPEARTRPEPASSDEMVALAKREHEAAINREELWTKSATRASRGYDDRPWRLVGDLRAIYFLATGRNPLRSPPDAEARDPSVCFLHAVWMLAGVPRAEDTIEDDIRQCRAFHQGWADDENYGRETYDDY